MLIYHQYYNALVFTITNPYFINDYIGAAKNYPMRKVSSIVATLRDIDVKSKGVGANALPTSDLLKEMLVKIFN
jgi:DNA polymerase-3 subunit delta